MLLLLLLLLLSAAQIKYCPDNTTIATIYKYGKNAKSMAKKAPNDLLYHLEAQLENVCYETNYTDPHYQSEGFVLGRCDESYNTLEGEDDITICDGHSEMNVSHAGACAAAEGACLSRRCPLAAGKLVMFVVLLWNVDEPHASSIRRSIRASMNPCIIPVCPSTVPD